MKSNCETASITTPSRVEMAPRTTGENTVSSIITARLLRDEPIDVRKVYKKPDFLLTDHMKSISSFTAMPFIHKHCSLGYNSKITTILHSN